MKFVTPGILGKVRKKLEKMERKPIEEESTRKEKNNSRNN